MANHEFAHCDNCLYFKRDELDKSIGICSNKIVMSEEVSKKGWCGQHKDIDPLNANIISVEYTLRRDHIMLELQHGKENVKPVEELLKCYGWDGTERIKAGKWPEESQGK